MHILSVEIFSACNIFYRHDSLFSDNAQLCFIDVILKSQDPLPFTYFGVFDGHAGTGAAIMAANMLHNFVQV